MDEQQLSEIESHRREFLEEAEANYEVDWAAENAPGSWGCHELLDRTALAASFLEDYVRTHPACIQNREWFVLADRAASALHELYQQVGEAHLAESE
jgi:hypothetical protein